MTDAVYVDHVGTEVKLGRSAKSPTPKIQLADYIDDERLAAAAPKLKKTVSHAYDLADFKMCGNDRLGDCTCAAVEHATHTLQWQDGKGADNPEDEQRAVDLYWATGSQDDGRVITNVLSYVRKHGYGGRSDAIVGYVAVDVSNLLHVCTAIDFLGGVDLGVALPVTAQTQQKYWQVVGDPDTDPDSQPGSWGGHSIWCDAYNHFDLQAKVSTFVPITWGQRIWMYQNFWQAYVDEAVAVVSAEWLNKQGKTVDGLDLAQLESDLKAL